MHVLAARGQFIQNVSVRTHEGQCDPNGLPSISVRTCAQSEGAKSFASAGKAHEYWKSQCTLYLDAIDAFKQQLQSKSAAQGIPLKPWLQKMYQGQSQAVELIGAWWKQHASALAASDPKWDFLKEHTNIKRLGAVTVAQFEQLCEHMQTLTGKSLGAHQKRLLDYGSNAMWRGSTMMKAPTRVYLSKGWAQMLQVALSAPGATQTVAVSDTLADVVVDGVIGNKSNNWSARVLAQKGKGVTKVIQVASLESLVGLGGTGVSDAKEGVKKGAPKNSLPVGNNKYYITRQWGGVPQWLGMTLSGSEQDYAPSVNFKWGEKGGVGIDTLAAAQKLAGRYGGIVVQIGSKELRLVSVPNALDGSGNVKGLQHRNEQTKTELKQYYHNLSALVQAKAIEQATEQRVGKGVKKQGKNAKVFAQPEVKKGAPRL